MKNERYDKTRQEDLEGEVLASMERKWELPVLLPKVRTTFYPYIQGITMTYSMFFETQREINKN